uniref:Uncharacterized protein n=1 Tax=Amphimedon queenslandica TaxID=400682 RepID=A0A1X7VSW9_AMPQE
MCSLVHHHLRLNHYHTLSVPIYCEQHYLKLAQA